MSDVSEDEAWAIFRVVEPGAECPDLERHNDGALWTAMGQVYFQAGTLGYASIHLDYGAPYISYEADMAADWTLDWGSPIPRTIYFESFEYYISDRKFVGSMSSQEPWGGALNWDYSIIFSEDFQYISGGSVVMTMEDSSTQ
jgi:hypothetical protein